MPARSVGEPQPSQAASPAAEPEAASAGSLWREQKLIRNASVEVEVDDVDGSTASVGEIASRHGGILADLQAFRRSSGQRYTSISVRVPAGAFDAALVELRGLGTVTHERVTTEDITKAYFDLETRLKVKRETAQRLREILANRTGNLADVIAAESELGRVTEEIEQLEGEKRFYDHRVATSTIQVSLTGPVSTTWSLTQPVAKALRDSGVVFATSVQGLIYAVTATIPWALAGGLIWLVVRRARRKRGLRNTAAANKAA